MVMAQHSDRPKPMKTRTTYLQYLSASLTKPLIMDSMNYIPVHLEQDHNEENELSMGQF